MVTNVIDPTEWATIGFDTRKLNLDVGLPDKITVSCNSNSNLASEVADTIEGLLDRLDSKIRMSSIDNFKVINTLSFDIFLVLFFSKDDILKEPFIPLQVVEASKLRDYVLGLDYILSHWPSIPLFLIRKDRKETNNRKPFSLWTLIMTELLIQF